MIIKIDLAFGPATPSPARTAHLTEAMEDTVKNRAGKALLSARYQLDPTDPNNLRDVADPLFSGI